MYKFNQFRRAASNNRYTLILALIILAAVYGYVMNIVKLLQVDALASAESIVRVIGIVASPVGAIAGFF